MVNEATKAPISNIDHEIDKRLFLETDKLRSSVAMNCYLERGKQLVGGDLKVSESAIDYAISDMMKDLSSGVFNEHTKDSLAILLWAIHELRRSINKG